MVEKNYIGFKGMIFYAFVINLNNNTEMFNKKTIEDTTKRLKLNYDVKKGNLEWYDNLKQKVKFVESPTGVFNLREMKKRNGI